MCIAGYFITKDVHALHDEGSTTLASQIQPTSGTLFPLTCLGFDLSLSVTFLQHPPVSTDITLNTTTIQYFLVR